MKEEDLTEPKNCNLSEDNKHIVRIDLDRTTTVKQEREVSLGIIEESQYLLCNFLKHNHDSCGYFQGLNFVAYSLLFSFSEPIDRLNCLHHLAHQLFMV